MEKAIDERTENLNTKKEERHKARKERYDGRVKRRAWERKPESEEAKRQRLAELEAGGGERVKRRKSLVLLGYSGVKYCGMQRNPDTSTIEEELLAAMLKNKWINETGFATPQQLQFQRAARTDKGVSACRQVVSLKLRKLTYNEYYRYYQMIFLNLSLPSENF
jgi:tRNA pseudouridine38-40 synthase